MVIGGLNLNKMKTNSLLKKTLLILLPSLVVCFIFLIVAVIFSTRSGLTVYFEDLLGKKYTIFNTELIGSGEHLYNQVLLFNESEDLSIAVQSGDKFRVRSYLDALQKAEDIDAIYLVNKDGSIYETTNLGVSDPNLFKSNNTFKNASSQTPIYKIAYIGGNVSILAINRYVAGNSFEGYIVLEKRISSNESLDHYKTILDCEVTVFLDDVRLATTVLDQDHKRVTGTKLNNDHIYNVVYNERKSYYGENVIQGEDFLTVYIPLDTDNSADKVMFFIGMPVSVIGDTNSTILDVVIPTLMFIFVVIVGIILIIIIFFVIKPLQVAAKAIHNLASGEADLTYRINNKHHDEIGHLCNDIDAFLDMQQGLIKELKGAENTLEEIGQSLSSASVESASAITEIMANVEGVRKQTVHQNNAISAANVEMNNSLEAANRLEKLVQDQSAGIIESSAAIEEMLGNISSVSQSVKKMSDQFNDLSTVTGEGHQKQVEVDKKITEMAAESQLLVEANTVIARIASQTNLLAMNAAIEAAHAGDKGAGFSVVADEIRALAENSSKQSHTIGQELKQITTTIQDVVAASRLSRDAFAVINEKLSGTHRLVSEIDSAMIEQNETSKQVLEALRDINTSTAEVTEMSKTMQEATIKTNNEMHNLTQITSTVSGSMDEMAAGAVQINDSAQGVSNMATETRDNIRFMDSLIGRFKTE